MKPRVRHHVNPLGLALLARRAERILGPEHTGEVEVELGCADARFLFDRAPARPETMFLGLELREPLVDEVNRLAAERGLSNLRACYAHINVELDQLFGDGQVDRFYVNFPDPWFKRRHHKRRLLTPELVTVIHRKLRGPGELFFQSDVFELALEAMETIEAAEEQFVNVHGAWSFAPENPFGAASHRELRCQAHGWRVWRLLYRRREPESGADPQGKFPLTTASSG